MRYSFLLVAGYRKFSLTLYLATNLFIKSNHYCSSVFVLYSQCIYSQEKFAWKYYAQNVLKTIYLIKRSLKKNFFFLSVKHLETHMKRFKLLFHFLPF